MEPQECLDQMEHMPLSNIEVDVNNPRRFRSVKRMAEMEESIRMEGVLQPIIIRPNPSKEGWYLVVAGETRYTLAVRVGLRTIPAIIKDLSNEEAFSIATIENVQRQDMNPIDEGAAAKRLLIANKGDKTEVCRILGWSAKKLDSRILITHAVDKVAQALVDEVISLGHAELLCGLREEKQEAGLALIIKEGLTISATQERIAKAAVQLSNAIFDTGDCGSCSHNSSLQNSLFDTNFDKARCLNPACFKEKTDHKLGEIKSELRDSYATVNLESEVAQGTYITLMDSGIHGVGIEQLEACQSCSSFGCLIKTSIDAKGAVLHSQCFNIPCHTQKVGEYQTLIASDAPVTEPLRDSQLSPAEKPKKTTEKKAKADDLPQKIVDANHAAFRSAAASMAAQNIQIAKIMSILSMMADGSVQLDKKAKDWPMGLSNGRDRAKAFAILTRLPVDKLDALILKLAGLMLLKSKTSHGNPKLPESDTFGGLAMEVNNFALPDMRMHFTMGVDYLEPHTKPVVSRYLEQSGFAAFYDSMHEAGAFKKLAGGSKKEMLEAVSKSGYSFEGYLPDALKLHSSEQLKQSVEKVA